MSAKAPMSDQRQGVQVIFWADMAFMGGLGLMILFLPISEALKNVGYFLALGGWVVKRAAGRNFRITFTPLGVFLSLYLLVSLLSAAFAFDRWEGLKGTWDVFRPLSLFLVVVNDINSAQKVRSCLWLFAASTGIGVTWGLVDYVTGHDVRLGIKSLGYPNHTATYLVLMLTLLLSLLFLGDWSVQTRIALGVLTGATLLALFLTYSRGGWIAFLASLLFLAVSLRRWRPMLIVVAAGILLFMGFYLTGMLWAPQVRRVLDPFDEERIRMWRGSLLSLWDHPFLGVGPRNFKNLEHEKYGFKRTNHAHNLFFTVMAERGLLGLVTLLALLTGYVWEGVRLRQRLKGDLDRALWHAAMGGFVTIVVAGLFNTTLHSEGAVAFWVITALLLASARLRGILKDQRC